MKDFKYSILSICSGIIANCLTVYIQGTKYMDWDLFILVFYIVIMTLIGWFAFIDYRHSSKAGSLQRVKSLTSVLYKYASSPDQLFVINEEGREIIGGHAGNYTWKEFAGHLCSGMRLKHLRYSNIGSQYRLTDIDNGDIYSIPVDNSIDDGIEKDGLRNGQILVIEKIT